MRLPQTICVCLILLIISSCKEKAKQLSYPSDTKPLDVTHEYFWETPSSSKIHFQDSNTAISIDSFYAIHKYKCLWHDGISWRKSAYELQKVVSHAEYYGLCSGFYDLPVLDSSEKSNTIIIQKDVSLSRCLVQFCSHLRYGVPSGDKLFYTDSGSLQTTLSKLDFTKPLIPQLELFEPNNIFYTELKNALTAYLDEFSILDVKVPVEYVKSDSLENIRKARRALFFSGFLSDSLVDDLHFEAALAMFQRMHGLQADSTLGRNTARLLQLSNQDRFLKAACVLNQLKREVFPSTYLLVNIPGFYLDVVQNNKRIVRHSVVVGKYSTATPRLISRLSNVQLNPFWNVPYSISSKEMLPKIKSDTNYLKRNRLTLLDKEGKAIDSKAVEWKDVSESTFQYRIQQEPGNRNALGNIKFNFPNRHQVYLHDTDSRGLFDNDNRAYSHGCVRVDKPVQLASVLLGLDSQFIPSDTLKSQIKKGSRKAYSFRTDVQIRISYYTSMTDAKGIIQFYDDIYRLEDKTMMEKFKKYLH